jgi:hypothetical protein
MYGVTTKSVTEGQGFSAYSGYQDAFNQGSKFFVPAILTFHNILKSLIVVSALHSRKLGEEKE